MKELEQMKTEAKFLTNINLLAEMFGCSVRVDLNSRIAYFDGDPQQCELLAEKLCEVFREEDTC